jgi:hypothetical protein
MQHVSPRLPQYCSSCRATRGRSADLVSSRLAGRGGVKIWSVILKGLEEAKLDGNAP